MDFYEPHPFGVLPNGNVDPSVAAADSARRLGALRALDTPTLLYEVLSWLDAPALAMAGATCTGLYITVHCTSDAWRSLAVAQSQAHQAASSTATFAYEGTWRATAIALHFALLRGARSTPSDAAMRSAAAPFAAPFPGRPWYDDAAFQSWMCTIMPPDFKLLSRKEARAQGLLASPSRWCAAPKFLDVPREAGLSVEAFKSKYERPNRPVILTDVATSWPLYDMLKGDLLQLRERASDIIRPGGTSRFRCESLLMSLGGYVDYAERQRDERPVYLFDADFVETAFRPGLWSVPECFAVDDLFEALGNKRPNYRWLIAGPARAGSSFHIDPNFTNAWNACLTGSKRWLMFPPDVVPPGVFPSRDMSDVTTPVSLTEWLLNYYEEARTKHHAVAYECICRAGETIFVPCGWWHCVINLEASVAVTQNYVSDSNLDKVITFLRSMPKSISGIGEEDATDATALQRRREGFYTEFAGAVKAYRPDLTAAVDGCLSRLDALAASKADLKKRPRFADLLLPETRAQPPAASTDGITTSNTDDDAAAATDGFVFSF